MCLFFEFDTFGCVSSYFSFWSILITYLADVYYEPHARSEI